MRKLLEPFALALALALACALPASARAETYQKPPEPIRDVLEAPALPEPLVSPDGKTMLLFRPNRFPPIADLAAPMLRLAGLRINPRNNGPHSEYYAVRQLHR